MRILLFILGFIFLSFWLATIIEVSVAAGMKIFYKNNFQNKQEEKKNESI